MKCKSQCLTRDHLINSEVNYLSWGPHHGTLKYVWWWWSLLILILCLYLAAAAWQSLHPCRHPPLASSPALWSVFLQHLPQPPSLLSRLEAPLLKSQASGKKADAGPAGGHLVPSTVQLISTACSKQWAMFECFPVLGEDFGHPLPTWLKRANGGQGQDGVKGVRRSKHTLG